MPDGAQEPRERPENRRSRSKTGPSREKNDRVGRDASRPAAGTELVDIEHLFQVADGDVGAISRLVSMYFEQTGECLEGLGDAVRARDFNRVRSLAHSSLGASRVCGMTGLVAHFSELERMGAEANLGGASAVLAEAGRKLGKIRALTAEFLGSGGGGAK